MQKFSRAPRVSIVIPHQQDEKLFEETVLSVLENQPAGCQVVAVHNGTYSDPFDLGDEVSFATARSSNLVDLVRDAFDVTTAPIVHVLGSGMKATPGWLDEVLDRFDDSKVAAVAPARVDSMSGRTVGSGWSDASGRFCQPNVDRCGGEGRVRGFFLDAFLVRRSLLGNLLDAVVPAMNDCVAVSYAFGCLLRRSGWKIDVASETQIQASHHPLGFADDSDLARGQRLAAIRSRILPEEAMPSLAEMLRSAVLGPSSLGEMAGMLRHRCVSGMVRRAIDLECVPTVDQLPVVLRLPESPRLPERSAA